VSDEEDQAALLGGFRASSGGPVARFAAPQAAIIRDLVGQVAELVSPDDGPEPATATGDQQFDELAAQAGLGQPAGPAEPPEDPVLARLLPSGYRGDDEAAADFRRYTESGLRSAKLAAARTVLATLPADGGRVRLSEPEAEAWLRALNDVRLALGVVLGITDEADAAVLDEAELAPDDPVAAHLWVYQWLAVIQESLVAALS
jgi:hypothetical protein